MTKAAIIGCGYVGSALANHWTHERYWHVTGTTTSVDKLPTLKDLCTTTAVIKGDSKAGISYLADRSDVIVVSVAPRSSSEHYENVYLKTAETIKRWTNKENHIIFISSTSVYGDTKGRWVDENAALEPSIMYESEKNIRRCLGKSTILRLGGIYGPGREVFEKLKGIHMPTDGNNYVNFTHLDDIIGAIDFVVNNQLEGTYNVVRDCNRTFREMTSDLGITWGELKTRKSVRVSNTKLKQAGYQFKHL